ncbi:DNA polymerase (family 10) [Geoalkalibacter ferrihydriticus]|uniref:DNA polymerase beta n=1 Tax=Geoalkalibacter ferrihydriticus TaxID=392333 RepID=A0A1G9MD30_9BACT|nr:DNA polymerase (family 10) [Geoalkalibacter ferrihydriticus]
MKAVDRIQISDIFQQVAQLLEVQGGNPYRVGAYRRAARSLVDFSGSLDGLAGAGRLREIPGIGEKLAQDVAEVLKTGDLALRRELLATLPKGVEELLRIPNLGPKRARILLEKLQIGSLGELEYACNENRLLDLPGFGARIQDVILAGIERLKRFKGRFLLSDGLEAAALLTAGLANHPQCAQLSEAGSVRRGCETVKDVDLVAAGRPCRVLLDVFYATPGAVMQTPRGNKAKIRLKNGLQVDLHCVSPAQFPAALLHYTGSREHNIALREHARGLGFDLSPQGLRNAGGLIACASEEDLYRILQLAPIAPELRENRGEIAAAAENRLPRLVQEADLRGVFHVHTVASDGRATLAELAAAARARGWSYLGICDHSQSAHYARGLDAERVREQWRDIDELNSQFEDFQLLKGIESDILVDGRLDYPDELLAGFDFVIASIHSHFNLGPAAQTRRLLAAIANPRTTMLGHPSGRLLLARDAYQFDQQAVLQAAARHGVVVELNANPQRLDLDWRLLRTARDLGVLIAINPDAHSVQGLDHVRYGVISARKGWLEARDILNCREKGEMLQYLRARRAGFAARVACP